MEVLIEIRRPPCNDLVGCHCEIETDLINKYKSVHQVQHVLSRQLISAFPNLLITPTEVLKQIQIIVPKELYFSPKWQEDIVNSGLQIVKIAAVDDEMLEAGVRFTMLTKVAPEWNRAGGSLIHGNDFLKNMLRRKYRRISVDVHCNSGGQMYMKLYPDMVKLHPLELWQTSAQHQFVVQSAKMESGNYSKQPDIFRWCLVFPKLSRGQLVGMRHSLSEECGFRNYAELREFWWQSYGYSLPVIPPKLYYEVYFAKIPGISPLLYPDCCVLSGPPAPILRLDQDQRELVLRAFLQVMCRKMTTICGQQLDLKLIPSAARVPRLIPLDIVRTPPNKRKRDTEDGSEESDEQKPKMSKSYSSPDVF